MFSILLSIIFNMPRKTILKRFGLTKRHENLIFIPLGTVVLLIFCVLLFGFGLDKQFMAGTASGYITDNLTNPVSNAVICIEDYCVTSSKNGYFKLENIPVGEKQISISSQQHNDIHQKIFLSKGENTLNLSLTPAELADGIITLTSTKQDIFTDSLKVTLNDKYLTPKTTENKQEVEIQLFDIKAGKYKLKLTSDYYMDQDIDIVFEPNIQNTFPVVLAPATSLSITTLDWLDSSPLGQVTVSIGNEIIGETNTQGVLLIPEISILTKEIKLKKDGYIQKILPLENLVPQETLETTTQLIPDRKIAYTKQNTSGSQIVISNYDGSDLKQLTTTGNNYEPWIDRVNERVYFRKENENSRDSIQFSDYFGEDTKVLSGNENLPKRLEDIVDYKNDIRFYIEETNPETKRLMSSKLDDSAQKELLLIENQEVNNLINTKNSDLLIYGLKNINEQTSKPEGVYATTLRFNRTSKLLDSSIRTAIPQAISDDNKYLALTIDNDIFLYTFADKSMVRLTSDNHAKTEVLFVPKQAQISYIQNKEDTTTLMLINILNRDISQISPSNVSISSYRWEDIDIFSYISEDQLYIASLKNKEFPQLVTNSVSY